MAESVKVAVRVRPFNQREKDRKAKLIINMDGHMTSIQNPESNDAPKKFSFDYSYWSHSKFTEREDGYLDALSGSSYASQRIVFNDLGQGVLDNALEGYNTSLFAYGQTGSGKSYSMVGYGVNKGIVPITCDEMFKVIESNTDPTKRYEVTFSMLEIYNERVKDLLIKDNPSAGLPVRENPKLGLFYVDGLKRAPVGNYKEIERKMEIGTHHRTVASTNMNATSSRAHTVVTIIFDQIVKDEAGETKKSSIMNLVDLAGSERADSTGATGDRLKEGANINKSLSALGNVISALADLSTGKKSVRVPYRDSVLTKLLQNALGGNSKTIMIAALSPADINYDETLSTLRYADRAKKIKNKAVVNENPMDKLIRELREENERLRKAMEAGGFVQQTVGMSKDEIAAMRRSMEEEIRSQLSANQQALDEQKMTWEQKLAAERKEDTNEMSDQDKMKRNTPHLANLNEDPMLSGVIFHFLKSGKNTVGRKGGGNSPQIPLTGPSILPSHAILENNSGECTIRPGDTQNAHVKLNGVNVTGQTELRHKDRVVFGSNHVYVFYNPLNKTSDSDVPDLITYEFAQKEIAEAKGFNTAGVDLTKDQQIAQEQVLELLPLVAEVNAISEELNKHRAFEVVLISAAAQEGGLNNHEASTKVMVKMKNLLNSNTWLWERGKFMNRRYIMQELYQQYLDGDDSVLFVAKEQDPFWEPAEDVLVGSANAFLQSLAYALDFNDELVITDYKGHEEGKLRVSVAPCTQNGKPLDEDYFVENPKDLLERPFHFKVCVNRGEIVKSRFMKGVKVAYKVLEEETYTKTKQVTGTLEPKWEHSRIVSIPKVTERHLEYFEGGFITFLLYGVQDDTVDSRKLKMTTRELRQMDTQELQKPFQHTQDRRGSNMLAPEDTAASHLRAQVAILTKKLDRLSQKESRIQQLCRDWEKKPESEKQFEPFFNAIKAAASSSGTKFKTRVELVQKMLRSYKVVKALQGQSSPTLDPSEILRLQKASGASKQAQNGRGTKGTAPAAPAKEGSRACSIM